MEKKKTTRRESQGGVGRFLPSLLLSAMTMLPCDAYAIEHNAPGHAVSVNIMDEGDGSEETGVAEDPEIKVGSLEFTMNEDGTTVTVKKSSGASGNVEIPGTVQYKGENLTVTGIGTEAFLENGSLTSVMIPASVTSIGKGAFYQCKSLSSVTFAQGSHLETIGKFAFANTALSYIMIPASVTSIGEGAFYLCYSLGSVTFAQGSQLKTIGKIAFTSTALSYIMIPASVTSIGDNAFEGCDSLSSVTFAQGSQLKTIGDGAFASTALSYIMIPSPVTSIDGSAFWKCSNLKMVIVESMEPSSLGKDAFYGTSEDLSIYVPEYCTESYQNAAGWRAYRDKIKESLKGNLINKDTITYSVNADLISVTALYSKSGVTSYVIPDTVADDDGNVFTVVGFAGRFATYEIDGYEGKEYTSSLESITIPASVKIIGGAAFQDCQKLNSVTFAEGSQLKTIDTYAFQNSTLTSIKIPASVTSIGEEAFKDCSSLSEVDFLGASAKMGSNCLDGTSASILVPESAYSQYVDMMGESWKDKIFAKPSTLELTDETGFKLNNSEAEYFCKANDLTYSRTASEAGQYVTLCLPFDVDLSETADMFQKVYVPEDIMIHYTGELADKDDGTEQFILMLIQKGQNDVIPAGTTMIAKLAEDEKEFVLTNAKEVVLSSDMAAPEAKDMRVVDWDGESGLMTSNTTFSVSRGGTYNAEVAEGRYTFNANGTFGPQKDGNIPPFRMFLNVESISSGEATPAKLSISIGVTDDTTTGVKEILSLPSAADAVKTGIYTIDGRRVKDAGKLTKGIYIKDGKKVIVQ